MEGGPKLEAKFLKIGKELSSFPPENDLFAHLEEIDGLLSNVEQSPSRTMLNALQPLIKALATKDLLQHSDMDVKVAVASCISEITRITAPETPYDDVVMKEIFRLIVGSFAGLDNTSSRSYKKRISILETVAKVRSCVVMLDLECDDLIHEMFHQFVKRIREENSESVFSCMETIMTLVIEESEDVPIELLSVLLYTLKNDMEALPIAQHLAENVLNNCASRITPYLVDLVRTIGAPLNEYHKVIASICQENSSVLDKQEETNDEVKVSTGEDARFPENDAVHASVSNGSVQNGNADVVECPFSPIHSLGNEKPENFISDDSGCDHLESNINNSEDAEKYAQSVTHTENSFKETGFPTVNENSTTVNHHSVSVGSEKKNEASISVQVPIAELETSITSETKQKNISNVTTVQKGPKVSQINGNTDSVADPTTSAHVEKRSGNDIPRRDDVACSKNDASEFSKGDNVEAPTTVKSDNASKPKRSILERGRKGKKGKIFKGRKFISAAKVPVQEEKGTSVKVSPSNDDEFENKSGKADDIETPKSVVNKSEIVLKTIGKRGRPRKEHAVEKVRDSADLILHESEEKGRDTSVVISPSKGGYFEKKPEVANDVKAQAGKRGRPRKEHAVQKEKDPTDQVLQESVEKERGTSVVISPSKGDYSEKKPEFADDVKAQMISVKESVMGSRSYGKRGRPKKKHATGKGKGRTDKVLPVNCDANVKESSALDKAEASKSLSYERSKLKSKSKRGRPKKKNAIEMRNVSLDEILLPASNTSQDMHIIKCKGSQTKGKDAVANNNAVADNNEPLRENFSLKGNKTGKAESIDDVESPNGLTNDSFVTPKRKGKKGRPKKSTLEKESNLPNAVLPFKSEFTENPENFETLTKSADLDMTSKTKGKRGRPRKELVTQESPVTNKPSAKKQKGDRNILQKDVDIGSTLQETASSLKPAFLKSQSADKANADSIYEPRSRRKRATNTDDIYVKNPVPKRKLDERLVGSKIKVWWPDDDEFYEGIVDSYDRDTKHHKIAYTDGDVEVLLLKDELWEYVGDRDMSQTKAKTDSTSKLAKSEEQTKSMAEPSSKETPRPRGRPRKEIHSQKSDVLPDNISPESMKQPKERASSDEKITAIKILSKLKDVVNSPSSSGGPKAKKKGAPGSGTKLKVTFSRSQPNNETESTPLSKDPK